MTMLRDEFGAGSGAVVLILGQRRAGRHGFESAGRAVMAGQVPFAGRRVGETEEDRETARERAEKVVVVVVVERHPWGARGMARVLAGKAR